MFVLASASPRRKELLEQIRCKFIVKTSFAEEVTEDMSPQEIAEENARRKASAIGGKLPVLGADTLVTLEGKIYGKPKDAADAALMLKNLAGKCHTVITGIAFCCNGNVFSETVGTRVYFGKMTSEEIANYVATVEPLDKAGAYGIQGMAAAFIEKIHGSYSNVVGLPLFNVCKLARKVGVDLWS